MVTPTYFRSNIHNTILTNISQQPQTSSIHNTPSLLHQLVESLANKTTPRTGLEFHPPSQVIPFYRTTIKTRIVENVTLTLDLPLLVRSIVSAEG